jgi:hypothetical protein
MNFGRSGVVDVTWGPSASSTINHTMKVMFPSVSDWQTAPAF